MTLSTIAKILGVIGTVGAGAVIANKADNAWRKKYRYKITITYRDGNVKEIYTNSEYKLEQGCLVIGNSAIQTAMIGEWHVEEA